MGVLGDISPFERKVRARLAVCAAIKRGELTRPSVCSQCGATDSRIHGHHADYFKPLEVVWLCIRCHAAIHSGDGVFRVQVVVRVSSATREYYEHLAVIRGVKLSVVLRDALEDNFRREEETARSAYLAMLESGNMAQVSAEAWEF